MNKASWAARILTCHNIEKMSGRRGLEPATYSLGKLSLYRVSYFRRGLNQTPMDAGMIDRSNLIILIHFLPTKIFNVFTIILNKVKYHEGWLYSTFNTIFFILIAIELAYTYSKTSIFQAQRFPLISVRVLASKSSVFSWRLLFCFSVICISTNIGAFLPAQYHLDMDIVVFHCWLFLLLVPQKSHEINALWAAHVVHHQSEEYNLTVALRQSWFQGWFSWIFYLPVAFIGFNPIMFLTMTAFNTLYQFWIHTRTIGNMGWLEYIFNTPSHHRGTTAPTQSILIRITEAH